MDPNNLNPYIYELVLVSNKIMSMVVSIMIMSMVFVNMFMWINDLMIESNFGFTRIEQMSIIYGIKIMIFSELMLFISCFWCMIDFRIIMDSVYLLFSYSLITNYSFSIPYSNLFILLFSSLPIQSSIIFYKVGFIIDSIEQLSQTMSCGLVFLVLQIKEFLYYKQ